MRACRLTLAIGYAYSTMPVRMRESSPTRTKVAKDKNSHSIGIPCQNITSPKAHGSVPNAFFAEIVGSGIGLCLGQWIGSACVKARGNSTLHFWTA